MFVAPLANTERLAGQNPNGSHVALAINAFSMIAVSRFPGLPIPIDAANIHVLYPTFRRLVAALAGHPVTVSFSSAHGIPVLGFSAFTAPLQGTLVTERIYNAFVGDVEYELRCQSAAPAAATIAQACTKMIHTLAPSMRRS
jgi:hypothetical protein